MRVIQRAVACVAVLVASAEQVQAGLLYAIQRSGERLVSIDTNTLTITDIGPLGVPFDFGGLAYDPSADVLYGVGGRPNPTLFSVDRSTGTATTIGTHGVTDLFGLAFDTSRKTLYGSQFVGGDDLFTIDTANGSATLVGDMAQQIGGLAYDSLNDRLIGIRDAEGDLYEIDRDSASQTFLYDGAYTNNSGLAFDPDKNLFWNIDLNGNLYSYDPTNAFARTTHLTGIRGHDGLAYVSSSVSAVPEPSTLTLFGIGACVATVGAARRRRVKLTDAKS